MSPPACGTVRDSGPGMSDENGHSWWGRKGSAKRGFRYTKVGGGILVDKAAIRRIERLAIPPAWTDVHISPDSRRRVQAWGRDAAGRKQYRYSEAAVAERDRRRWRRVLRYARDLPAVREATNRHLERPEPDREKVLATVVRLMGRAFFRVGSERYATQNKTFGLVTLKKKHIQVTDTDLVFRYVGKQRKDQRRVVADTPLVEIVEEILALPGRRLFRYLDHEGKPRNVTAPAVNRYIREIAGKRYTSKDLRTFGGTVRAATILADIGPVKSKREAHRNVVLCCRLVASELGNTPAVAKSAYIHPAILEEYEERGRTIDPLMRKKERRVRKRAPASYYPEEAALMRFLEKYG